MAVEAGRGTALVTGASRGIGRAVAIELAGRGFDVVATMRRPEDGADLADLSSGRITVAHLDVTDPASIAIPDGLTLLVNNAGVECAYLPAEHQPLDDWRSVFDTNVFGLVEVTRRALPVLRSNGGGVIANITSAGLLVPMPFYAVYRASKAAVAAYSESLRVEVEPLGIHVVEVLPGPVDTDMLAASARMPEAVEHEGYEALARAAHAGRASVDHATTPVDEAARIIVDALTADAPPAKVASDAFGQQLLDAWFANPRDFLDLRLR